MPPQRTLLTWEPSAPGPGNGAAIWFFSGYESLSDTDRLMRLRELPHVGDDIAAARAAGYRVLFEMHGTREGLVRALTGTHPACPGIPARGVIWNGHGEDSGAVIAHDGEKIDPAELPGDIARFATARLFVLGCCSAGAHADRWCAALGGYAHVFGWPMPVDVATGIDFYTSDPGSQSDLDDLMLQHLGVRPSAPVRHAETSALLRLEWELAVFYGANPLAVDSRALAVGQRVLGQWRNGRYFPCVLGEFDGERFLARWDDGDEPTWLQPWQVRPEGATRSMRVPGALRIGAHCHARWTDGSFYPALLTDWNGSHLLARWDDGSPPLWIDPSNVIVDGAVGPAPAVGMHVRARWKGFRYFWCVLAEQDGERFLARWDDGDEPQWVDAADVQVPLSG